MNHVYLIPGFFGFANLGELRYFAHVRERLELGFSQQGKTVSVHYVQTLPTASLNYRAAHLLDEIAKTCSDTGAIYLVGHSTGGLDARLLTAPEAKLPSSTPLSPIANRVRGVVTIASPHYGTPQAKLFATLQGQRLLKVLSVMTLHSIRVGSLPISVLLMLAGVLPRVGQPKGPVLGILDQIYRLILKDFDGDRQKQLEAFLTSTSADQSLIPQLGPHGMAGFNASHTQQSNTRYGCVVAQGRPPSMQAAWSIGAAPQGLAMYATYRGLYQLATGLPKWAPPDFNPQQLAALRAGFGDIPSLAANDAIVPTLSQVFGEVIHVTWADHLDVVGHFGGTELTPPHADWLTTRSGFDLEHFDALWADVAAFMLACP